MDYLVKVDAKKWVSAVKPKVDFTLIEAKALRMERAEARRIAGKLVSANHRATVLEAKEQDGE